MNSDTDRPGARHGCRFVATLALTALACVSATIAPRAASAAQVGQDVDASVAASADAGTPVVITFKAQVAPDAHRGRPGELIRALRTTADDSQRSVRRKLRGPSHAFWLVNAISTSLDAGELAALRNDPNVASIDLDPQITVAGVAATPAQTSWGVGAIHAPDAWSRFAVTGTGVRVGSIDTGVDASNPELTGAVAAWKDFVGGSATPYDDNGHGTHTIGTMVARNVGGGQIGVAPGATVVVAKAMRADGSASGSTLLEAAQWMTDPDGNPATADYPTVINNSWTAAGAANEWFRPMVQTWVAMGIAPVFGAGNTAGALGNPASYPESITVGQLDQSGGVVANSSRGIVSWTAADGTTTQVTKPDITAPGAAILSTVGSAYGTYSGSSMAAPHVAGAIALLRQARPDLTVDGIREILRTTAVDRGLPGLDLDFGAGALDVAAAVAATGVPAIAPAPLPAAPAATTRPAPAASAATTIKVLRVVRRGRHLLVKGRVSGPARIKFSLRPTAPRAHAVSHALAATNSREGTFSVKVPVGRLQRRAYILVVTASNAAGDRLGSTSVPVRLR